MSAVALPDPELREKRNRIRLEGEIPSPRNPPSGCPFHPRCPYSREQCITEAPALQANADGTHLVACHFPKRTEPSRSAE